jgi:hypothetical protein
LLIFGILRLILDNLRVKNWYIRFNLLIFTSEKIKGLKKFKLNDGYYFDVVEFKRNKTLKKTVKENEFNKDNGYHLSVVDDNLRRSSSED